MAVELNDNLSGRVVSLCNQEGLLLNPVRPNAVRFMPPLTVTAGEIDGARRAPRSGPEKATRSGRVQAHGHPLKCQRMRMHSRSRITVERNVDLLAEEYRPEKEVRSALDEIRPLVDKILESSPA